MKNQKLDESLSKEVNIRVALQLKELFDTFYSNHGLQNLIEKAREIFRRPMLIHDLSFKILAISIDMERSWMVAEEIDGELYLSNRTIEFIHDNNVIGRIRKNKEVTYINKPHPQGGTLLSLIRINGVEAAHIAIHEYGIPFEESDYLLAEEFNKLLSLELQRDNSFLERRNLIPAHIFTGLLKGQMIHEDAIKHKLHYLKWTQLEKLSVMVITDERQKEMNSRIPLLLKALKPFIPMNHCMIYQSQIIVFLDIDLYELILEKRNDEFCEFLAANHVCAGVSMRFDHLMEFKRYYKQAVKSSELAQQQNMPILRIEDCAIYLLSEMIQSQYDIMDFTHPAVIQLMKSDQESKGDLLLTLKLYITNHNTPNEAAKQLNIHRNTLFYRINKIKDMTGISFNNMNEIFRIYFSIRLLEINHMI